MGGFKLSASINKKEKVEKLIDLFARYYPDPSTALNFNTPFELLIATILSAQTTDIQVNKVTADLFEDFNTPESLSKLSQKELEEKINSIGLYRNKSKYILKTCDLLIDEFEGEVPKNRKDLLKLSGVGRKTANVVLANAFFKAAFPVDTHVFRVSKRLGLSSGKNVEQTEKELTDLIPKKYWTDFHHWLIDHGRAVCKAQNPDCDNCFASDLCSYYINNN